MDLTIDQLRNFVYVSLISADNTELTEEVKQELIQRTKDKPGDWEYILEPLGDKGKKLLELFENADRKS